MKNGSYWKLSLSTGVLALIALFLFGPSGQDDSHITYSAARQLAETGQLLNINGEWVEQGSSMLHVLLLAALHGITNLPLPVIGTLFSLIAAIACVPLVWKMAQFTWIRQPLHAAWLLALSTAFTYWAMGGLESTLVSLLMCSMALAIYRFLSTESRKLPFILLLVTAAFLLSRPEAYLIVLAFSAALAIFLLPQEGRAGMYRKLALFLLVATLFFAILCAARLYFYGQIFPQPVYAKGTAFSLEKIGFGFLYYVYSAQPTLFIYSLILLVPVLALLKRKPVPLMLAILCSLAAAHLAFVITSGGDWMIGGRFFVPAIPLLICVAIYHLQDFRRYRTLLAALMVLSLAEIAFLAATLSTGIPLPLAKKYRETLQPQPEWNNYDWTETGNYVHIRDILLLNHLQPVVAAILQHQKQVEILTIQMGMIPYHVAGQFPGRVHFTDMKGLVTSRIPHCPAFDRAERNWTGVLIQYQDYFSNQRKGLCNLPEPDIIFDMLNAFNDTSNQARVNSMEQFGYRIIYRQQGNIIGISKGKRLRNEMFIAIREPLYEKLPAHLRSRQLEISVRKPDQK